MEILGYGFPVFMTGNLLFLRMSLKPLVNEAFESALEKDSHLGQYVGQYLGTLGDSTSAGAW